MDIKINWDTSVDGAPQEFKNAINYVVNLFDATFTNPVIINIDVGWGEIAGRAISSGTIGESQIAPSAVYDYSTLRTALIDDANSSTNPLQLAAVATLPTTDPANGGTFNFGTAEAKALGLVSKDASTLDGYVGFNSTANWSFSPTANPSADEFDFIGVAEHEITELMGRVSGVGTSNYSAMDLFRYSAAGLRDLTPGQNSSNSTAYFSIDNGKTALGSWNNKLQNGDLGDWYPEGPAPGGNDAFNDISDAGVLNRLSSTDLTLMNVLGWNEVSCFMRGTMIRTPAGDIAVEMLRRGDLVTVADGRAMPVSWIGRQTVSTRFADPLRLLPVRIRAGALGDNVPSRDLLLSPDHAVFVVEILVHAGALVNGSSIVRETNVPQTFTYYHVELDEHCLILADNAPAESFIDNVERLAFDNWQEHQALHPQGKAIVEMVYPRAKSFRQVPGLLREYLGKRGEQLYRGQLPDVA
jgi:Hint domain